MDLLDRYLEAVKKYLPWQRQDDIIAELRANLESQLEDREAELGRPLTKGEVEEWLKQMGPPIHVAARYQPQRYLIGPAIFPFYWYVMRLAFTWAMIVYAIVIVVQMFFTSQPSAIVLLQAVLRIPLVLLTTFTWVTLVFAVIEFVAGRYPEHFKDTPLAASGWSPAWLPPVENVGTSGQKRPSYAQAVAEVIVGFVLLAWLLLFPHYPYLLLGPAAAYLNASPFEVAHVLVEFYWVVVALNILQLGWRTESLLRGSWQRPQPMRQIAMKAMGLIPVLVLLFAPGHVLVLLKHPEVDQIHYGVTMNPITSAVYKGLIIVCVIISLQLLWEIGKTSLMAYRKREAAMR